METLWLDNLLNIIETIGIVAGIILTGFIGYFFGCFVIEKFYDIDEDDDDEGI